MDVLIGGADSKGTPEEVATFENLGDERRIGIHVGKSLLMLITDDETRYRAAKVLDYDALYDALAEKKIAGAGLDVYPIEPIPAGNKFLSLRNVVLTPHLAGSARDIVGHQTEIVLTDVKKILAGENPQFICNPEVIA